MKTQSFPCENAIYVDKHLLKYKSCILKKFERQGRALGLCLEESADISLYLLGPSAKGAAFPMGKVTQPYQRPQISPTKGQVVIPFYNVLCFQKNKKIWDNKKSRKKDAAVVNIFIQSEENK